MSEPNVADPEYIRFLEELSLNAFPAASVLCYDGWLLRFNSSYSRRANSVQSLYPSSIDVRAKIAHCEQVYAAHESSAIFKLTPAAKPADLDAHLAAAGYGREGVTKIQVSDLANTAPAPGHPVCLEAQCSERWLEACVTLNGVDRPLVPLVRALLQRIIPEHRFGSLVIDGTIVAVGLVVVECGYASLWDVVVDSSRRRGGLGTALVQGLLHWGREAGASHSFLAVVEENTRAQSLYARFGFRTAYTYWYRAKR